MSKALMQKKHFKRRLKQRYEISLKKNIESTILHQIQAGHAEFLGRRSLRVTIWKVEFGGKMIKVVYDSKRHNLVTALPIHR